MQVIPLISVPSQQVSVTLANQSCQLKVYQKRTGLYMDVRVLNAPIVIGVPALYANLIVRDAYLGFIGDFAFFDLLGEQDPSYDGLGLDGRYFLSYLSPGELGAAS